MKQIDIVCTIGHSSWDPNILEAMMKNGMTVARFNGAFIDLPEMDRVGNLIRRIAKENNFEVRLLLDIKGHELRLNKFHEEYAVNKGDTFLIGSKSDHKVFPVTYPDLYKVIKPGRVIKINKGAVALQVQSIDYIEGIIITEVISRGIIKGGKGMNVPSTYLENLPITDIDLEQISYAIDNDWEIIAGSFIRNSTDVQVIKNSIEELKNQQNKGSYNYQFIAKIEDQFGISNLEEILDNVDGVMIARGDMSAEIGYERIPAVQIDMLDQIQSKSRYSIVATEMLESMLEDHLPSNADVADIVLAIKQGADAIMLSGETAFGNFPVECVEVMSKLIDEYSN